VTVCAVLLIASATAVKFALTSAAFAGVPATNVFGIVVAGAAADAMAVVAMVSTSSYYQRPARQVQRLAHQQVACGSTTSAGACAAWIFCCFSRDRNTV
jgi:hypothetical protein